jgi:hypothetical protein
MVILNQIVGVGDFSIADNLRLIVIAAIFIGIIVVLLRIRFARSVEKTNGKNNSKEEADEDIEDIEDLAGSAEGTEEDPVVNSETIEEKIKNSESEIIAKFAEVIKDIKAKIDTKLTAETEDIRAEFTTKIEQLISKIEKREKEVANKIENVIDTKVQDALNKMNDRIGVALHTQKSSTASVLEKLVDSLRTEEASVGSLTSEKAEERESDASVKDQGLLGKLGTSLQMNEGPVSASFPDKSAAVDEDVVVPEEIEEEELDVPFEDKTDAKLEENVSEGAMGDAADFDMQEFLDEEPVGISSSSKSNVAVEEEIVPEGITEDELEAPSEGKADVKLEENVSEGAMGDTADFDMQEFLDTEPVVSFSDESDVVVEEDIVSEAIAENVLEAPSEGKAGGKVEKKVSGEAVGDSADFDIQGFLDELENLPSENDSETEK